VGRERRVPESRYRAAHAARVLKKGPTTPRGSRSKAQGWPRFVRPPWVPDHSGLNPERVAYRA